METMSETWNKGCLLNGFIKCLIDCIITGEFDIAYNVLESYVLPRLMDAPDLKILRFDDYQLAIPRTAFIPKQADDPDSANRLVRFFLSQDGQNRLAPSVRLDVIQANRGGAVPLSPSGSPQH